MAGNRWLDSSVALTLILVAIGFAAGMGTMKIISDRRPIHAVAPLVSSYNECILAEMKGRPLKMIVFVRKACEKRFSDESATPTVQTTP